MRTNANAQEPQEPPQGAEECGTGAGIGDEHRAEAQRFRLFFCVSPCASVHARVRLLLQRIFFIISYSYSYSYGYYYRRLLNKINTH